MAATALASSAWLGRRTGGQWRTRDAVFVFLVLLWGSLFGGVLATRWATGAWQPEGELQILPALIGTGAGGLLSAACALLRADVRKLGFVWPISARWWLVTPVLSGGVLAVTSVWGALLEQFTGEVAQQQQIADHLQAVWPSAEAIAIMTYAVAIAPFVEELFFRGLLWSPLEKRLGWVGAMSLSGIGFGLMHLSDPQAVPPLVVLGMVLGWLRWASGSLGPPLALHILNNGLAVGALLLR